MPEDPDFEAAMVSPEQSVQHLDILAALWGGSEHVSLTELQFTSLRLHLRLTAKTELPIGVNGCLSKCAL